MRACSGLCRSMFADLIIFDRAYDYSITLIFVILILLFSLREPIHLYPSLSAHSVYTSLNVTV
jgi:hypothetical protein